MSMSGNLLTNSLQSLLKSLENNGYEILNFSEQPLNKLYTMIALNKKAVLGRGSYGVVYQPYPIDITTGELILEKKLAVKVYRSTKHVNPSEAKFFDSYYSGAELLSLNGDMYMIMACMPGEFWLG